MLVSGMASPSCRRCKEPLVDAAGDMVRCPSCGGPLDDECAICENRERRGDELEQCIGCSRWICARPQCSRASQENLVTRAEGRACTSCGQRREIVLRVGAGKGAGSAAGVEAIERGRYYLYEATLELEGRLRQLSLELTERIAAAVEARLERLTERGEDAVRSVAGEVEAALSRQIDAAADKLGRALEEALARGLERGAGRAASTLDATGRSIVGHIGARARTLRSPLLWLAVGVLVVNALIAAGLVLALR
jgi:hypothetical protein